VKATIAAVVTKLGGLAERRSASGHLVGASSFDDLDLELGSATIDLDHDPERKVGQVIYAELTPDERLAIVGVVEGLRFDEIEQPVYASGSYEMRGDVRTRSFVAREAQLLSVGLTFSPANLEARPLRWRPGDIRDSADRMSWPISWQSTDPLLARALDDCGTLRTRTASRIVDRRDPGDNPWQLREGQLVAARPRLAGGLRYGAPGRVLRVS
jgi:hypothetical protein